MPMIAPTPARNARAIGAGHIWAHRARQPDLYAMPKWRAVRHALSSCRTRRKSPGRKAAVHREPLPVSADVLTRDNPHLSRPKIPLLDGPDIAFYEHRRRRLRIERPLSTTTFVQVLGSCRYLHDLTTPPKRLGRSLPWRGSALKSFRLSSGARTLERALRAAPSDRRAETTIKIR